MPHLSPVSEELIATIHQMEDPSIEKLDEETTRPRSLIEESIERRLSRRFLTAKDDGSLFLTEAGEQVARKSPLTNQPSD
jgi:predicted transcriptional regulator